jgi:putative Holliday junction resolvase
MKYLGIDYGSKKIGLAISDKEGGFAFPSEVLLNKGLNASVEMIATLIKKEDVEAVVVGHSANFRGKDNPIMRNVRQFVDSLKREVDLPIYLEPEFMTSVQAARVTGKDKNLDAQAAALILQSFLDKGPST